MAAIKGTDYEHLDLLPDHHSFRKFDLVLEQFKQPQKRLRQVLRALRKEYDYVILDCPPSGSLLSEGICVAADLVLVPMIPTTLCRRTCEQLMEMCERCGLSADRVRPFFSMVQPDKKPHRQTMEEFRAELPNLMAEVAKLEAFEEAGVVGRIKKGDDRRFTVRRGSRRVRIKVCPMEFQKVLRKWPESNERKRAVLRLDDALKRIKGKDLRKCVKRMLREVA